MKLEAVGLGLFEEVMTPLPQPEVLLEGGLREFILSNNRSVDDHVGCPAFLFWQT